MDKLNQKQKDFSKEIKTIQKTWDVLGIISILVGIYFSFGTAFGPRSMGDDGFNKKMLFVGIMLFAWGCSLLFVAHGLAKRKRWAKEAGILISVIFLASPFLIGLFGIVFTIFGIIWLAGLLSSESKIWFSESPTQDDKPAA